VQLCLSQVPLLAVCFYPALQRLFDAVTMICVVKSGFAYLYSQCFDNVRVAAEVQKTSLQDDAHAQYTKICRAQFPSKDDCFLKQTIIIFYANGVKIPRAKCKS